MKLIHSNYEILEQGKGLDGINEQIELAGRTCYKSEPKYRYWSEDGKRFLNKDTEDFKRFYSEKEYPIKENISAKDFVDRMIKSGHLAMLEHGTVYLAIPRFDYKHIKKDVFGEFISDKYPDLIRIIEENKYSKVKIVEQKDNTVTTFSEDDLKLRPCHLEYIFVTTNYRVIIENGLEELLQYICEPTKYHEKRITVKFTCDRGVSHEFVRHRVFSFAQESTRYCNYSKDKFSNEITYICPCWLDYDKVQKLTEIANKDNKEVYRMGHDESLSMEERGLCSFVYDMSNHEHGYLFQISTGWKAQEARAVLPNSLKTELVMTGFVSDWEGFFKLRDNSKAHPDARALAKPLHEEFIKKGYIDGNLD